MESCPDIQLKADPCRLKQILTNLISNACKFSPSEEPVIFFAKSSNDSVELEILNSGPGIPISFQDKVFDDFTQADSSSARKLGGTGLGLSIVKKLVELHNGTIAFVSEQGVGTTFTVKLPNDSSSN